MDNTDYIDSLYQQMKSNGNLAGSYHKTDSETIVWDLFNDLTVIIGREYIGIDRKALKCTPCTLIHWHPEEDDMLDAICSLGTKGNVTVIHKTPLATGVVYCGPKEKCEYKRKWLFGRYFYLFAE